MAQPGTGPASQDNTVLQNFWPTFNQDITLPTVECSTVGSLAEDVLDTYGIPKGEATAGGSLQNIDIKRMDALTVIKQSLMEDITTGAVIEPMVNAQGTVDFVTIGNGTGVSDVYYTVQTYNYTEPCAGVMVTGGRPLPQRKTIEWKPIWGTDGPIAIYSYQDMLANCHWKDFNRYASIVFYDPNLRSEYEDGIDNLFEIESPWDRIIGYVVYKEPPAEFTENNKDYTIEYVNQTTIPIKVGAGTPTDGTSITRENANLGTALQLLPTFPAGVGDQECWTGEDQGEVADFNNGVEILIPEDFRYRTVREIDTDAFSRVAGVYVIGKEILLLHEAPADDAAAVKDANGLATSEDMIIWASIDDTSSKTFQLKEGYQYSIAYDEADPQGNPWIVFSKDVHPDDVSDYGTDTVFRLDPFSKASRVSNIDYAQ